MGIKNVWGVYFSATKTTKTTVESIVNQLSENLDARIQYNDFTLPKGRENTAIFTKDDIVVVGVPVYAGHIPQITYEFLSSMKGNGAMVVPVVVYGNRAYEWALDELESILTVAGFMVIGGGAFIGEHSYSNILAQQRPDTQDIEKAKLFADELSDAIKKGGCMTKQIECIKVDFLLSSEIVPKTKDSCINCGICSGNCPTGAISPLNANEIIANCIKCCACVKNCPIQAKYIDSPNFLEIKERLENNFMSRKEPEYKIYLG